MLLVVGLFLLAATTSHVRILGTLAAGVWLLTMAAHADAGAASVAPPLSVGPILGPGTEGIAWPASLVLAAWLMGRVRPTLHLDVTHRDAPRLERTPDEEVRT